MATGKISRLPREIREQLNRRLDDGVPGNRLVAWLNELPAVRALLAAEFGGAAINEQNLSNWKQGGFRDWRMQEDARAFVQSPAMTLEQLVRGVAARYAALVCAWRESPEPVKQRKLRVVMQDAMKLQRKEQLAQASELNRVRPD
ncbi:MAG TPA: hypothetical protein VK815_04340 [Candidatus Acidoferrales bacterium]|jgi:hypothetical protein|nr:hypothetical protein [Candidatus Acidoferrales bacterium]